MSEIQQIDEEIFADPRGSSTEITDEMLAELPTLVERGCTLHDVLDVFGLSSSYMSELEGIAAELPPDVEWKALSDDVKRYLVFMDHFNEAMRSLKLTLFSRVYQGAQTWSSAAWLLQRRFPEEFNVRAGEEYEPLETRAPNAADREVDKILSGD